ncbi:hypothetical protein N5923_02525 [Erwiniaceae bacterium BAC15a-03b]|uniref:Uncharacterized protein n=1 Tax=Winslowiella arboricola TaxID=2978220 RepID=A0A9J6PNW7_9GAMM|nr:hypothetical protein [Winslowiella arboricola]MCU5771499.1 hypothetical protein [Winslowiella arboricola]MCU5776372.1 hypothetical protein [Winslowiella arboricola]
MFAKLKQMFNSQPEGENKSDEDAERIEAEFAQLESTLLQNPADNATQKQLMVKYNQAVKIFSGSKSYRSRVDDVFVKMDELRNTIRRNI